MPPLELLLPLTATGRKYGYIIWPHAKDAEVRALLGEAEELVLVLPGGGQRRARVDWKHHRVSIGYSITRGLPPETEAVTLARDDAGRVEVVFS